MQFKPMNGYCVVRRADSEAVSPGGIVIPETAQKKSEMGQVLSVCPLWKDETGEFRRSDLKVGDIVIFSKYVGEEFMLNGKTKVLLIKESSLLSMLIDDEPTLDNYSEKKHESVAVKTGSISSNELPQSHTQFYIGEDG